MSDDEEKSNAEPESEGDEDSSGSSEGSSDDDGSSSDDSSSDGSDADNVASSTTATVHQTGEDGHVLSAYELQRLERIQRNKEKLKQLGLEGDLVPKKQAPRARKRREQPMAAPRSSLSRTRKRSINYAEEPGRKPSFKLEEPPQKKKKKKAPRMDRVVYDEFQRIAAVARQDLQTAKSELRQAKIEHRHATKVYESFRKKERRRIDAEKRLEEAAREKRWLGGKTKREALQYLDRTMPRLLAIRAGYERSALEIRQFHQLEEHRRENERKLQMIDALNRFPIAVEEAAHDLDILLLKRSPKDPPPPRRGTRKRSKSSGDPAESSTQETFSADADNVQAPNPPWPNPSLPVKMPSTEAHAAEPIVTSQDESPKKPAARKKEFAVRNVGGWISPEFSASVKRSWLECDKPSPEFVPQIGDVVLYYPGGHSTFLKAHPDLLGRKSRNKYRVPLWERAKKELVKKRKAEAAAKEEAENEEAQTVEESPGTCWFNEEWLSSDLSYPLLCRVEKTHAEFPPDPNAEYKLVNKEEEGGVKVVWALPGHKKKKKHEPPLCLVVQLHPLCPLLPPQQDPDSALSIPPRFSVSTFPSNKVPPFIVPFSWAYRCRHSLSIGDSVRPQQGDWKGHVDEFAPSSSLDDKIFPELLSALDSTGPEFFMKSLEAALSSRKNRVGSTSTLCKLPFLDVCAVTDCIVFRMRSKVAARPDNGAVNFDTLVAGLIELIRNTLPLWNGVTVKRESKRRVKISAWDLAKSSADGASSCPIPLRAFPSAKVGFQPETGVIYTLDEPLRAKIECTIEDYIKDNEDSSLFLAPVTDEVAPSYSCAVPLVMCFERILRRLKHCSRVGEQESRCHYRSVDSILSDLSDIGYNCVLYNSPDSDVVTKAIEVIPPCKTLISQLVSSHLREKGAREKADNERRRLIMLQCDSSAKVGDEAEQPISNRGKSSRKKKSPFAPFITPLNRTWIQNIYRDGSWNLLAGESKGMVQSARDSSSLQLEGSVVASGARLDSNSDSVQIHFEGEERFPALWAPQSGDAVLYSRSLHSKFIKGHYQSLTTEQCILPPFSSQQSANTASGLSSCASDSSTMIAAQDLNSVESKDGESGWIVGKVVWVRASFPRDIELEGEENTFDEASPLLALGICFEYSWTSQPVHTIFWRPCILAGAAQYRAPDDEHSLKASNEHKSTAVSCASCGLSHTASFLRPAWTSPLGSTSSSGIKNGESGNQRVILPDAAASEPIFDPPLGLRLQDMEALDRCFDFLKRRCLGKIRADFIDPKFCMDSVKRGSYPVARMGTRLPSFEHLFLDGSSSSKRRKRTTQKAQFGRGRNNPEETQSLLAGVHYLPPWSSESLHSLSNGRSGEKDKSHGKTNPSLQSHEMMAPNPTLCLELIQLRLRSGYYRQKSGLVHDIQEAYVTTVIQTLSQTGTQKTRKSIPRISVMKIARALRVEGASETAARRNALSPAKRTSKSVGKKKHIRKGDSLPPAQRKVKSAGKKKKIPRDKITSSPAEKKPPSHNDVACKKAVSSGKKKNTPILNEEELLLKKRMEHVRKLYATAFVCVTETSIVERIFGTAPQNRSTQMRQNPETQPRNVDQAEFRSNVHSLLSAVSRDPCLNRVPSLANNEPFPSVKVKITVSGGADQTEEPGNVPTSHTSSHHIPNREQGPVTLESSGSQTNIDPMPDMSKPILFAPQDYVANRALVRAFFGRPGRREACARCQANNRSMITCRVRKGHSNTDFDLVASIRDFGGVDSLVDSLANPQRSLLSPSVAPTMTGVTSRQAQPVSSVEEGVNEGNSKIVAPLPIELHPSDILERAQLAVDLANKAVDRASAAAKSPPKLSEDFIRLCFPIDPSDGHYNYCITCGLSGDVLCCEGCANVSHSHCANLSVVPDGDWYCSKCTLKDTVGNDTDENTPPNKSAVDVDMNQDGETGNSEVKNTLAGGGDGWIEGGVKMPLSSLREADIPLGSLSEILEELRAVRLKNSADTWGMDAKSGDAQDEQPEKIEIGSKIVKKFETHGDFKGTVTKMPTDAEPYYGITYDDGDEEDMSEDELRRVLIPSKVSDEETQKPAAKRGRGRPPGTGKRRRGRPRKDDSAASALGTSDESQPKKRKRGRPRKNEIR